MDVIEIPIDLVEVSDANTRKNLQDGQVDSTIEDLAQSIERHGLLSPISVFETPDGRYALVAGQRRFLAFPASRSSVDSSGGSSKPERRVCDGDLSG